jgi:hypothetical protein
MMITENCMIIAQSFMATITAKKVHLGGAPRQQTCSDHPSHSTQRKFSKIHGYGHRVRGLPLDKIRSDTLHARRVPGAV